MHRAAAFVFMSSPPGSLAGGMISRQAACQCRTAGRSHARRDSRGCGKRTRERSPEPDAAMAGRREGMQRGLYTQLDRIDLTSNGVIDMNSCGKSVLAIPESSRVFLCHLSTDHLSPAAREAQHLAAAGGHARRAALSLQRGAGRTDRLLPQDRHVTHLLRSGEVPDPLPQGAAGHGGGAGGHSARDAQAPRSCLQGLLPAGAARQSG